MIGCPSFINRTYFTLIIVWVPTPGHKLWRWAPQKHGVVSNRELITEISIYLCWHQATRRNNQLGIWKIQFKLQKHNNHSIEDEAICGCMSEISLWASVYTRMHKFKKEHTFFYEHRIENFLSDIKTRKMKYLWISWRIWEIERF